MENENLFHDLLSKVAPSHVTHHIVPVLHVLGQSFENAAKKLYRLQKKQNQSPHKLPVAAPDSIFFGPPTVDVR
jgi:hypothetical protein